MGCIPAEATTMTDHSLQITLIVHPHLYRHCIVPVTIVAVQCDALRLSPRITNLIKP